MFYFVLIIAIFLTPISFFSCLLGSASLVKGLCFLCLPHTGSGLNDCTSCRDYLTLDGGMCIECRSGRYYNLSSQRCEPCSSSCLTCSSGGERSCTSCQSPKSLHTASGTCRICCPPGILEEEHNTCCSCDPLTGLSHCKFESLVEGYLERCFKSNVLGVNVRLLRVIM